MKSLLKTSLFLPFFALNLAHTAPLESKKYTFGGGLNVGTVASEIGDEETPDSSNFINDQQGAVFKRNGSKRYISVPTSSNPVNSLYRIYVSTNNQIRKALIMASRDSIYYSTWDVSPTWIKISSNLAHNQRWNWATMNKKAIGCGDKLTDQIKMLDIVSGVFENLLPIDVATNTVYLRAKYPLVSKNYLLLGNTVISSTPNALITQSTFSPSSVYYSLLTQPSSFTISRFLEIRTDDGEEITGMGELNRMVHIFKESSITELDFTVLNLTTLGGDQVLTQIVQGFGLFAPATLANTGDGYILGTKDGLRFWDGGRKSRLTVQEESRVISEKIKPIVDRCIRAGTWRNAVGKYYPKKQWYILAYEDPKRHPKGVNNSVLVLDITTGNWFPFKNWLANSFVSFDGISDNGELLYGDSNDGYVHWADLDTTPNDSRLEIVLDTLDDTSTWTRSHQDRAFYNVKEGTGALQIRLTPSTLISSTSHMKVWNVGEFYDKTIVDNDVDKLFFRLYIDSVANLSTLRVDLERADAVGDFDSNFSSVTFSSGSLNVGNTTWMNVEILLSSFPIRPDWVSLDAETLPFADTLTFFGIRFFAQGIGVSTITIDDLRIVQGTENALKAYRKTKQFRFDTVARKRFRQVVLNRELPSNSKMFVDISNNFGQFSRRVPIEAKYAKEIFSCGYGGTMTITKLNSVDFSVIAATSAMSDTVFDVRYAVVDSSFIYAADKTNNRIIKINRSSMTVFVSTYGSLGENTTNFQTIQQIDLDETNLYITDVLNNRIKVHNKETLEFVTAYGQLGTGPTSYHSPTGIAVDENFIYVGNGGNTSIMKLSKFNGSFVSSVETNINTVSEITLEVDDRFLYVAYNSISDSGVNFKDIVLEKRDKQNLSILNRTLVKPENVVANSTYALKGSLGLTDSYIFISFTDDDFSSNGSWYIQKRLKSDFSIVKEFKSSETHFTPAANGVNYEPQRKDDYITIALEGSYLQLSYSEEDLDNPIKLFSQTFLIVPQPVQEK